MTDGGCHILLTGGLAHDFVSHKSPAHLAPYSPTCLSRRPHCLMTTVPWSPTSTALPCRFTTTSTIPRARDLIWSDLVITHTNLQNNAIGASRPYCPVAVSMTCRRYVNNLNAALEKYPELQELGIVDLNKAVGSSKIPSDIATKVRQATVSLFSAGWGSFSATAGR